MGHSLDYRFNCDDGSRYPQGVALESNSLPTQNFIVFKTHRNKYLLIYLSPLLVLLLLLVLQRWTEQNFTWENLNPAEFSLNPVPRCHGEGCITLGIIY